MAFTPRLPTQVERDILAKILGRTNLNDVNVGSTLQTLVNAFATELSSMEARMFNMRRSFAIQNSFGSDLDARVKELPPNGISRITSTNASGAVLKITRLVFVDPLTITAPAIVQNPTTGINYETTEDIIFAAGEQIKENVFVVSTSAGEDGNCDSGKIITVIDFDIAEDVTVTNTKPLTNGVEEETDQSLQARALRFIKSLNRTTPDAVEFLGTSFVSTTNTVFPFASLYEDNARPGYAELVVDDGTGLQGQDVLGMHITGVAPSAGLNYISHDFPATEELTVDNITIRTDGGVVVDITEDDFISIPERGVIYFNNGIILQDYTYEITNYKVFRGAMAELQKEIEGNPSFGNILTGFRSAGCRVRVVYPIVQNIVFEARVIIDNNFNIDETLAEVQEAILAFVNSRDVGQELRVADMTREIMTTQNILSIAFFDGPEPLEDTFTASGKEVIRIREADIEVTSVF
jgi:uncharacterized phage protein gp47/JayE